MGSSRRVGVLGGGHMGAGIAQTAAVAGCEAVCVDIDASAVEKARRTVTSGRYGLERAVELGKLTAEQAASTMSRLTFTDDRERLADVDIVIEAIPEDYALKVRTFADLDRLVQPLAVFASNSSGLPISAMAGATERPDRVIGWHWASPAPIRPLAEIVVTKQTSKETTELVCELATQFGKNPIVVRDTPASWGYVTSRIYVAAMREARRVVDERIAKAEDVDQLMIDCYAWPAGPLGIAGAINSQWGEKG
ncbi:MAG TPA: 3-hydroxyacyl-CoA dehydrogenase family protein [Acidimicrobiales bacterium]|nr:3-hydroxyacyl-CoA dehydrogenase family protein [Acidimicrobiales bacterium]